MSKEMNTKKTKTVAESFFWAVKWNFVEAIIYQLIFVAHQTAFFWLAPTSFFGLVGSLFGIIYVIVTLLVVGSDGALTPFFSEFNKTKTSFTSFLSLYTRRQLFVMTLILVMATAGIYQFGNWSRFSDITHLHILILLATICVTESLKKIIRYLLQLCFQNKATTLYELLGIGSYTTMVWSWYWYTGTFTLLGLFVPFLISSLGVLICISRQVMIYAMHLPTGDTSDTVTQLPAELTRVQILISINHYGRTLFSGNVIIPLFALYAGSAQAGLASFANAVTHTATFFIQKLSVPPGAALLTRVQHADQQEHHHALRIILHLGHVLALISSVGILLYGLIKGPTCCGLNFQTTFLFGFFFFIHVLENLFMIYEKYFLIKNRTGLLVALNVGSLAGCGFLYFIHLPFFVFIISCFFIRLALLLVLNRLIFTKKYL